MADTWTMLSGYTASNYVDTMVFEVISATKKIRPLSGQTLVAGEKNSQYVRFEMDRFWDGIDISAKNFSITYSLAGKYYGTSEAVSAEVSTDRLRFGWIVPEEACCIAGTLMFVLVIKSDGYVLKTQIAETPVVKSLDEESVVPEPTREAWYKEFQARVQEDLNASQAALTSAQDALTRANTANDAASSALTAASEANLAAQDAIEVAKIRYGSPLVANAGPEMVDTNRVYVFTGSESAYTYGHWYYYDNGVWNDGGVYNGNGVNTDKTLSIENMPADAKKTGDEISDLKEDLTQFSGYQHYALTLGKYYATNGSTVNIATPSTNNGWKSVVVPCSEGDKFKITGHSGSSPRLWCFVNASENTTAATSLSVAVGSASATNLIITAPANTTHLVCNFNKDYDAKLEKGETFSAAMSRIANVEAGILRSANSVFTSDCPELACIIDARIYVTGYEKVAINYFWYNPASHPEYEFYVSLKGYKNGTWESIGGIYHRATTPSDRPVLEEVNVYTNATLLINWNLITSGYTSAFTDANRPIFKDTLRTDAMEETEHIEDFAIKDTIANIVHVASDGTGDYTTLTAAYAAITDSAFDNQYEIIVHDGTYQEQYLTPPPYTHTHGTKADNVIITSVGLPYSDDIGDWLSVFQILNTCKLSNMTIISGTKYCIHEDANRLSKKIVICDNLIIKQTKAHNNNAVGNGTQFGGTVYIFKNCTFVNGAFSTHSNTVMSAGANQRTVLESCKFIDAFIVLSSVATSLAALQGLFVFEVINCVFPSGVKSALLRFGEPITGLSAPNFPWTLCGSGNDNFGIAFDNNYDSNYSDCWDAVNTVEKTFVKAAESISKGDYVTADGHITTQSGSYGVAVGAGSSGDYVPVWTGKLYAYP